jgi:hypothetical protein
MAVADANYGFVYIDVVSHGKDRLLSVQVELGRLHSFLHVNKQCRWHCLRIHYDHIAVHICQ